MAILFTEPLNGTPGTVLTTANTGFTFVQNAPTFAADSVLGSAAMRATHSASSTTPLGEKTHAVLTTGYYRWYTKLISTGTLYYFFQTLSGTTVRAALSVDGTGGIRMRQGTTGLGVLTPTKLLTTAYTRIEFAITPTTLQLRLYQGANLHGTTPTYDSGVVSWTSPGNWDRVRLGSVLTVSGVDVLHDELAADSEVWLGSAQTATVKSGSITVAQPHTALLAGRRPSRGATTSTQPHTALLAGTRSSRGSITAAQPHTALLAGTRISRGSITAAQPHTALLAGTRSPRGSTTAEQPHTALLVGTRVSRGSTTSTQAHTSLVAGTSPLVGVQTGSVSADQPHTSLVAGARVSRGATTSNQSHTALLAGRRASHGSISATVLHEAFLSGTRVSRGSVTHTIGHTSLVAGTTPGVGQDITTTAEFGSPRYGATMGARQYDSAFGPSRYNSSLDPRSLAAEFAPRSREGNFA